MTLMPVPQSYTTVHTILPKFHTFRHLLIFVWHFICQIVWKIKFGVYITHIVWHGHYNRWPNKWFHQQFYGDWHEISRIEHDIQRSTDCVTLELEKVLTGIARIQFESHFLSNHTHLNRNGIAYVSRPADNHGDFNVIWEADQGNKINGIILLLSSK